MREGKPVPNADLWAALLDLCERHAENERCHVLATQALQRGGWPADEGYERAAKRGLFDDEA